MMDMEHGQELLRVLVLLAMMHRNGSPLVLSILVLAVVHQKLLTRLWNNW